jgi:hypothetical protein
MSSRTCDDTKGPIARATSSVMLESGKKLASASKKRIAGNNAKNR